MFGTKSAKPPASPAPGPEPTLTPAQFTEARRQHERGLAISTFWQPPLEEMRKIGVRQMRDVLSVSPLTNHDLELFLQASHERSVRSIRRWLHRECLRWGPRKNFHCIAIEDYAEWERVIYPLLEEANLAESLWRQELMNQGRWSGG